jgi:hypothetical protein
LSYLDHILAKINRKPNAEDTQSSGAGPLGAGSEGKGSPRPYTAEELAILEQGGYLELALLATPQTLPSFDNLDLLELAAIAGADPLCDAMLPSWEHRTRYMAELVRIGLPAKQPEFFPEKRQEFMIGLFLIATAAREALDDFDLAQCGLGSDFRGDLRSIYRAAPFGTQDNYVFLEKMLRVASRVGFERFLLPPPARSAVDFGITQLSILNGSDTRLKNHLLQACWPFFDIYYNDDKHRSAHDRMRAGGELVAIFTERGVPADRIAQAFVSADDGDLLL